MTAVTTRNSHVNRALSFFTETQTYFAIGKTTPWSDPNDPTIDDTNPPDPTIFDTDVQELIGFKKVEVSYMVVPDDANGTISFRDGNWRTVSPDQAHTEGAKYVYLEAWVRYDELPLGDYRQIGVYTGVELASGVSSSKFNLLPSEVSFNGYLEVLDNRKPNTREIDQKEKLSLVIEF